MARDWLRRARCLGWAGWLSVAAVAAAEADGARTVVAFANHSPLEIVEVSIRSATPDGGGGTMTFAANIVPQNDFALTLDEGERLIEARLDLGLARYAFKDLAPFAGRARLPLSVGFADDDVGMDRLYLELPMADGAPIRVYGAAEWKLIGGDFDIPALPNLFSLFEAGTLADVRELGGENVKKDDGTLLLPVRTGEWPWMARVAPENDAAEETDEAAQPVGRIVFWTTAETEPLKAAFKLLEDVGYRPWYWQRMAGASMDTVEDVKFDREGERPGLDALLEAAEMMVEKRPEEGEGPGAILCLFAHPDDFAKAAAGERPEDAAVLLLRLTNGLAMELRCDPDGGTMLLLTR